MKIFLIGKKGQVGEEIDRQARDLGYEVFSYGSSDLDITDHEKVKNLIEKNIPEFVINASAYHVVPECELYPEKSFAINAIALKNLAEICDKVGSKLIHYSTDYVFDGLKGKPYIEKDNPKPLQVYGISKLAGESFALQYSKNSIIIRTCGVYGGKTGSRAKKGNFVLTILEQVKGKRELEVSSEQIVSPTFAGDLAKATLQLLQKSESQGIYHVVNSGYCSWAEFAMEIVSYSNAKTQIIPVDRGGASGKLNRPLFSALSNVRAKQLGIVLPPWQQALHRYLDKIL